MAKSGPGDRTHASAKPPKHEDTSIENVSQYHHKDINDNRLVWEVLEEAENG